MANISVIGAGYVGLVTGACFADLGNTVTCVEIDEQKLAHLAAGDVPYYEPRLDELVERNVRAGRLNFTSSYSNALSDADFIFIAVNTPASPNGHADMSQVQSAAASIGMNLTRPAVIINKSTMPIGAYDTVTAVIRGAIREPIEFAVVSNPEFLSEGSAVHDFLHPDRIILGAHDLAAAEQVAALYAPLGTTTMITDPRTAEMIKYAANCFLATKISFVNEIAAICDRLGADVKEVARGMGLDRRIGPAFLNAGLGWGGSCFPKDVRALEYMASVNGCHPQLIRSVIDINRDQRLRVVQLTRDLLGGLSGREVGILGLSFKPNTDDLRDAPALEVIELLLHEGARVRAYDPAALEAARRMLPGIELSPDAYACATGADALILATEWNEFKQLDLDRIRHAMRTPVLVDGRNLYDPEQMRSLGFVYRGIGRGTAAGQFPGQLVTSP
jgi:UDPglucose 6-dehydrogenase